MSVPVVEARLFEPARFWEWTYTENQQFYSIERYSVVRREGSTILLEMSSRLAGEAVYRVHHRLEVDLERCLAAYRNPVAPRGWSYQMYYVHEGKWIKFDPGSTLAFEEKFNCNPHVYQSYGAPFKTFLYPHGNEFLFEHKRWGKLEATRFYGSGANAGLAYSKNFPKPKGQTYEFRFVD